MTDDPVFTRIMSEYDRYRRAASYLPATWKQDSRWVMSPSWWYRALTSPETACRQLAESCGTLLGIPVSLAAWDQEPRLMTHESARLMMHGYAPGALHARALSLAELMAR